MSRPLPSWTPAQAIQVQRKYVSSDYNISATQRFVFSPHRPGYVFSLTQMYFYCWVEICTNDVDCAQRCTFICEYTTVHLMCCLFLEFFKNLSCVLPQASEGERPRREAASQPHQLQLVSLGPMQLVQNNTEAEKDPCMKRGKSKSSNTPN